MDRWNPFILSALESDEFELLSSTTVSLSIRTKWLKSLSLRSSRFYFSGFRIRLSERRGSGEVWGVGRIVPSWRTPSRTKVEAELVELSQCLSAYVGEDGPLWEAMRSEGIAGHLSQAELTKIACVTREDIRKRLESLSAAR
ncbi:hypothetical protein MIZ03_1473 [Rhodoferax lithotrophicus]|uniref:Uncharacterized protein n=2 Tax=Rhodoferax lithotrophicus TaxID=2798804 RepID=A0ABM7MK30_9BURK|nr:hypothetical protein MIZ03_1473 [Rhodoferax sp. MIZ03]